MKSQRGGFVLGLVVGLLVGLAVALGVALYITKAPVPFINKVPQRTAEQDMAEAERNRNWDPNAPLGAKANVPRPAPAASGADAPAAPRPASSATPARDPAAILAGGGTAPAAAGSQPAGARPAADTFVYHVQVGAFTRTEEADQQRAKMAMLGLEARTSEREQGGRTVFRVRVGPFNTREEAEAAQARLTNIGVDARLVRVEKP
jgi:cell division protein FtsN